MCCPFGPGIRGDFLSGPIGWLVTVLKLSISLPELFISVMDVSLRGSFWALMAATPALQLFLALPGSCPGFPLLSMVEDLCSTEARPLPFPIRPPMPPNAMPTLFIDFDFRPSASPFILGDLSVGFFTSFLLGLGGSSNNFLVTKENQTFFAFALQRLLLLNIFLKNAADWFLPDPNRALQYNIRFIIGSVTFPENHSVLWDFLQSHISQNIKNSFIIITLLFYLFCELPKECHVLHIVMYDLVLVLLERKLPRSLYQIGR
jgi:hypothetical protein